MNQPSRKSILVVDDYLDVRSSLRRLLASATIPGVDTFEVFAAGSCEEASLVAHQHAIDLVLLDLGMPDRAGVDWLAEYLAEDATRAVIVMSGADYDLARRAAFRLGARGFLKKPFPSEALLAEIEHAFAVSARSMPVARDSGAYVIGSGAAAFPLLHDALTRGQRIA